MDSLLLKQILRGIWVFLLILIILLFLYFATPLVYPFIVGWLIAYMLNPLVNLLQKKAKFPRWLSVSLSLLLFLSIALTVISLLVTNIVIEISSLADTIQLSINRWKDEVIVYLNSAKFADLVQNVNTFFKENPNYRTTLYNNLSSTSSSLASLGSSLIAAVLGGIVSFLKSLPNILVVTIIALLAAFFMSKDWHKLIKLISSFFPENIKKATRSVWADLQRALFGYVRAQLILISMTALFVIIGLIILNVKYAITIGLLTGLVDLLPYLGTGAVMVPWIIYVFIQGNLYLGIGLSVLYGIILVARQILEPKVLASSVGLNPLATLFALFVGLELFGFIGLIVGPVTLVLLSAFYKANVFRDLKRYILKGSIVD